MCTHRFNYALHVLLAHQLRHRIVHSKAAFQHQSPVWQNVTLSRALRDSNVPKLLAHNLPPLMGTISDILPGGCIPGVDYGNLEKEIVAQVVKSQYQTVPSSITKIIQLLEMQLVRYGVMVVGLTMCGKSTNSQILAKALTSL